MNARLEGLVFPLRAGVSRGDMEQGEAGGRGTGTSRFEYNLMGKDQAMVKNGAWTRRLWGPLGLALPLARPLAL